MDVSAVEGERHRFKRPRLANMAQATVSPQALHVGGRAPSLHNDDIPVSYERRRRTSHPHNHSQGPRRDFPTPDAMDNNEWPRAQGLPALEHRTSQTIVDLTGEVDEPRRFSQAAPPRLDRSDSQRLMEIVDLTNDEDDELVITNTRVVGNPQPNRTGSHRHRSRHHHDQFGLGLPPHLAPIQRLQDSPPLFVPLEPELPGRNNIARYRDQILASGNGLYAGMLLRQIGERAQQALGLHQLGDHAEAGFFHDVPNVPNWLNYRDHPFARQPPPPPPPPPKPDHIAPAAVPEGFTRSPAEGEVVICPACEEELVAQKVDGNIIPASGKKGKALKPKDTAEHPFWVIKDCGHVYCNNCYQNRIASAKVPANFDTITGPNGKSIKVCAVDECQSDVSKGDRWIGVYL